MCQVDTWQYINYTIYFLNFLRPPASFCGRLRLASALSLHYVKVVIITEDVHASNSISLTDIVLKIMQL
jgi:hypothetical protein